MKPDINPVVTMQQTTHIVLLRAVNVGGTGKFPMSELRALCTRLGFENPRTYIASGNLVIESPLAAEEIRLLLETELEKLMGKPLGVFVLSPKELTRILVDDPFPDGPGNLVHVLFLPGKVDADILAKAKNQTSVELKPGLRELYIYYREGQGVSKLVIPAAKIGTARNRNTIEKLIDLAEKQ